MKCCALATQAWGKTHREQRREKTKAYHAANPEWARANYNQNRDRFLARAKAWRDANPDKRRAADKAWRDANPVRSRATARAWREANRDQQRAADKVRRDANLDRRRAAFKAWATANPEMVRARFVKRRLLVDQQTPAWADREAIVAIYRDCPVGMHVDHIVPINGRTVSGLHCPENLQYLTGSENAAKKNRFPSDNAWTPSELRATVGKAHATQGRRTL
jgi:hypothetical protein